MPTLTMNAITSIIMNEIQSIETAILEEILTLIEIPALTMNVIPSIIMNEIQSQEKLSCSCVIFFTLNNLIKVIRNLFLYLAGKLTVIQVKIRAIILDLILVVGTITTYFLTT